MVRLEYCGLYCLIDRLSLFQFLNGAIGVGIFILGFHNTSSVSIPKWCDWSSNYYMTASNNTQFQFLNGGIGVCHRQSRPNVQATFQFLNGAIGVYFEYVKNRIKIGFNS